MPAQQVTREQVAAAVEIVVIVGQIIRELKSVPSGELYARLMGTMDLRSYEAIIDKLIAAKLVKRSNHVITWIGPTA